MSEGHGTLFTRPEPCESYETEKRKKTVKRWRSCPGGRGRPGSG